MTSDTGASRQTALILVVAAAFGLLGFLASSWLFQDAEGPEIGLIAVNQSFRDTQGRAFDLASLRGQVVVLNFWATWCPPCVEELPMLDAAHQRGEVHLIAVADDAPDAVQSFLQKLPVKAPVVMLGDAPDILSNFAVPNVLPFTVIIGRQGQVVVSKRGLIREQELQAGIAKAQAL